MNSTQVVLYRNGIRMKAGEFTETDEGTIVLKQQPSYGDKFVGFRYEKGFLVALLVETPGSVDSVARLGEGNVDGFPLPLTEITDDLLPLPAPQPRPAPEYPQTALGVYACDHCKRTTFRDVNDYGGYSSVCQCGNSLKMKGYLRVYMNQYQTREND